MWEVLKEWKYHEIMDLSWDIQKVRFNYKDIIWPWLLGLNSTTPGDLVDELIEYRKIH